MKRIVGPHEIYPALKAMLGLPEHLTKFSLHVAANEIVTVECEYYPNIDKPGLAALEKRFSCYELLRREQPAQGSAVNASQEHFDVWMSSRTESAHSEYMARHARGGVNYH